jgi:hypothetical protein
VKPRGEDLDRSASRIGAAYSRASADQKPLTTSFVVMFPVTRQQVLARSAHAHMQERSPEQAVFCVHIRAPP